MKLIIKTQTVATLPMHPAAPVTTTSVEVPNTTIAWGTIILAVIQAGVTLLSIYFGGLAERQTSKENSVYKDMEFQLNVLQHALEIDSSLYRATSLRMLIAAGLLKDPKNELKAMAASPDSIPKWDKRQDSSIEKTIKEKTGKEQVSGKVKQVGT